MKGGLGARNRELFFWGILGRLGTSNIFDPRFNPQDQQSILMDIFFTSSRGGSTLQEWSLKPKDQCFIITASRSHFSRDPSEYFENLMVPTHPYGFHPRGQTRYQDTPPGQNSERWNASSIISLGRQNASVLVEDFRAQHGIVLSYYSKWFTEIFKPATGVDVLSVPFDYQKKRAVIHGPRCTTIVLRYEDSSIWEGILRAIFPDFRMTSENRGDKKWYSEAYANFKKHLNYSEQELQQICATETEQHFYQDNGSACVKFSWRLRSIAPEAQLSKPRLAFSCSSHREKPAVNDSNVDHWHLRRKAEHAWEKR